MNKSRVIAIDASLTGLAVVVRAEEVHYFEYSSKPTKTLRGRLARYDRLSASVVSIIKEYIPELLLIEGYAFSAKGASVVTMGEFGGILRKAISGIADVTVEVPPTTIKKFITGKGNASKSDVISQLSARYGIVFKSDNHSDAYGLSQLGLVALGLVEAKNKHEREAASIVKSLMEKELDD